MDADEFEKALQTYSKEDEILRQVNEHESLGIYLFDCSQLKKDISNAAHQTTAIIFEILPKTTYDRAMQFSKEIQN